MVSGHLTNKRSCNNGTDCEARKVLVGKRRIANTRQDFSFRRISHPYHLWPFPLWFISFRNPKTHFSPNTRSVNLDLTFPRKSFLPTDTFSGCRHKIIAASKAKYFGAHWRSPHIQWEVFRGNSIACLCTFRLICHLCANTSIASHPINWVFYSRYLTSSCHSESKC